MISGVVILRVMILGVMIYNVNCFPTEDCFNDE